MNVKVTTYPTTKGRIAEAVKKATAILASEYLKGANKYVRMQTGTMRDTSLLKSDYEKGLLVWDTPYAKEVYYTGYPAKNKNPDASLMWADKPRQEDAQKYEGIFQKALRAEL